MRRLTIREVREHHGGKLPPDAILRPEDDEIEATPPLTPTPKKRRTRSERFADLNAFVDMGMKDLTGAETKVWLILFRDTKRTGSARTSQSDIARRAGLKPRMVRYALSSLERMGMVQVVLRGRLNAGPSIYRVYPTADP